MLSILQFADDTVFFCEDSYTNVVTLKFILRGYELASGLKINFHKSKLTGINVQRSNLDCYTKTLNCNQMGISFKYLGLEVGGNPRKKKFWEPVLNKLKTRLNIWKRRFLSMAGRICLIKSILTSVPLYYLSLFRAPVMVCRSITRIQRRFLWGWGKEKETISWVSWKVVCKSREEGGLGLRVVHNFNLALLAKWRWRLLADEKGRWKDLLASKYGSSLNVLHSLVKFQSLWWRDLFKACGEDGGDGWFSKEIGWKLGCGDKVKFWEDIWTGNSSLKSLYPRLFSLSLDQGQKVEEAGVWTNSVWQWCLRWRRSIYVWESELEAEMMTHLSSIKLSREQKDIQVWGNDVGNGFSVNSAYDCLKKQGRGPHSEVFKYLWKAKAFPSVVTTAWRILMNSVPTRECMSRRGVVLNNALCALCQNNVESCQHLFLECKHAMSVWIMCLRWVGIIFIQHNDVKTHFENFHLFQISNKQNMVWKGV